MSWSLPVFFFLLVLGFLQPRPPSEVSMALCSIYWMNKHRALPGRLFWISAPWAELAQGPQSPHFPREMFCALRPWLISDRKFLACSLHDERKLMAQSLCLGTKKDTGNDKRIRGWKTPAGAWGAQTGVWQSWLVRCQAADLQSLPGPLRLPCSHLSSRCRCSGLFYILGAPCLSQPSSKAAVDFFLSSSSYQQFSFLHEACLSSIEESSCFHILSLT